MSVAEVDAGRSARGERGDWPALPRRRTGGRLDRRLAPGRRVGPTARWVLRVLSLLVPLVAWFGLSASGQVDPDFLPSPAATWSAGLEMYRNGVLVPDVVATVTRIVYGFGLAVVISVPLGFAMGAWPAARALFEPVVGLLRYMPASAFVPLVMIWLGLGEPSKIALLVIGVVFFNTLMTADAVRGVPKDLLNVSATLGARSGEVVGKVIVPYALPGIIDAIRVNAAAAWNFVVVAELVAAETGLGARILRSLRFQQTDKIFAVLVVIGVIGLTIDVVLRIVRDRVGRWQP